MAMFISVEVKDSVIEKSAGLAEKLVEVCPVNIYKLGSKKGTVEVVEDNVDECTLCELCLKASPEGVSVKKLY
jgi:NAD-dependent dihydropyrimidine dehydrogenase PreA subunit